MNRLTKIVLSALITLVILVVSINIFDSININEKIKSFDRNDNESLFEICEYLYDSDEYNLIHKYYSKIFLCSDAFEFFSDLGFKTEQSKKYFSSWCAKFLISSVAVDNSVTDNDFMAVFETVQKKGIEKEFISALDKQIFLEYGSFIGFFESIHLKKLLNNMSISLENDLKSELKIECYSFLVSSYSSMGDFMSSDVFSWKRDSEIYKYSF